MSLINKPLLILLLSCFGCTTSGVLRAAEDLTFYVVDYPPYILVDGGSHEVKGIDVDTTRAAFASQGVTVQFQVMPWLRIVKSMEQGLIAGTVSCSQRPGREDYMLFSDSISSVTRSLVSKKSLDVSQIYSLVDTANFSMVGVEGWGMQQQLASLNLAHQTAPDIASAIKTVRFRNVDLLYMAEYPALYYIHQLQVAQDLKVTPIPNEEALPLYLCISKHYPNAEAILKTMNDGLQHIKESGQYDQIRSHYLQTN